MGKLVLAASHSGKNCSDFLKAGILADDKSGRPREDVNGTVHKVLKVAGTQSSRAGRIRRF